MLRPVVPDNLAIGKGNVASIVVDAPARQVSTFHFAVAFYVAGVVTTGIDAAYFYTRYFRNVEEVAAFALEQFTTYRDWAVEADALLVTGGSAARAPWPSR